MLGEDGALLIRVEDLVDADSEEEIFRNTERLISLGELSARVAHEIRNPLTGVRTTVQFVTSKMRSGDTRRDDLHDVLKELDRIEQIITDLLLFARPQAARPTATDMHEVVAKALDNVQRRLHDSGIEVEPDFDEGLPPVLADPDMAHKVVLNLVINAIQAMPDGGTLRVSTGLRRTRSTKTYVDVIVTDSGPGIPEDVKEKIFDPFFTTRRCTPPGPISPRSLGRSGNLTRGTRPGWFRQPAGDDVRRRAPPPRSGSERLQRRPRARARGEGKQAMKPGPHADDEELIRSLPGCCRGTRRRQNMAEVQPVARPARADPRRRLPDGSGLELLPRLERRRWR
jgi:hypothetical protein